MRQQSRLSGAPTWPRVTLGIRLYDAGRLSVNPLRRVDRFGTALLPLMLRLAGAACAD